MAGAKGKGKGKGKGKAQSKRKSKGKPKGRASAAAARRRPSAASGPSGVVPARPTRRIRTWAGAHPRDLLREGEANRAVDVCVGALEREPDDPSLHTLLGVCLHAAGRVDEAVQSFHKAIALEETLAEAYAGLAESLRVRRLLDDAVEAATKAVELGDRSDGAMETLCYSLSDLGRRDEAIAHARAHLAPAPGHQRRLALLGTLLLSAGELEAEEVLERGIEAHPQSSQMWFNLAEARYRRGAFEEATEGFRRANELNPGVPSFESRLAGGLLEAERLQESIEWARRSLEKDRTISATHAVLGRALMKQGLTDEAVLSFRTATALSRRDSVVFSSLLLCMHYAPSPTKQQIYDTLTGWEARFVGSLDTYAEDHRNAPDPERPIKVGYLSGGFHRHPVGYMIVRALENLDRGQVESHGYTINKYEDDLTRRIRAACTTWNVIHGRSEVEIAKQIHDDGIDILVDLNGHAKGGRLLAFARRPAPIQVKWVGGLFNSTGMSFIDYLLSDPVQTPDGEDRWFTEELVRLPDGYVCYDPPDYAPDVGPLPALERGHVTFGTFNALRKIHSGVIETWARILAAVPNSRLLLQTFSLGEEATREAVRHRFAAAGVDPARLDLRGSTDHPSLLAAYGEMDISLDTFPYSGGLTTIEAMLMGVPVVTLPGPTFAGRHAATHLTNVGMTEGVVDSADAYVARAVAWASDLDSLARTRAQMRTRVLESPLCDGSRFAKGLTDAYRKMWRRWCETATR